MIQGCMRGIPEATVIILMAEERAELEGLARSTKTEHRLRQRARIVLLAANGVASRAIGRAVGCTTGTASKWRVRYAEKRLAGLDETGNAWTRARPANDFAAMVPYLERTLDLSRADGKVTWVVDRAHIVRCRLRIAGRKRILAWMAPRKYGNP
jgi:Homeodomain-like domain